MLYTYTTGSLWFGSGKKNKRKKTSFLFSPLDLKRVISPISRYPQLSHGLPWKPSSLLSVKDVGKGGMKWEGQCVLGLPDTSQKQICTEVNINKVVEDICNMTSTFVAIKA
jgi:hypothetical protein